MASDRRVLEVRSYKLKSGMSAEFHRAMSSEAAPMLRAWGTDVVALGPSPHEADSYFLIRSYADLDRRQREQDAFYASDAWRSGPRKSIVGKIESYLDTVLWLSPAGIDEIRTFNT
ncbi:MAG: NIPSNAP family protein [Tahibacter sp.]